MCLENYPQRKGVHKQEFLLLESSATAVVMLVAFSSRMIRNSGADALPSSKAAVQTDNVSFFKGVST